MINLGLRRYVLKDHRSLPRAEQPVCWFRRINFGDSLDLQGAAKDMDEAHRAAFMIAHQLDSFDGFGERGQPLPFPRTGSMEDRIQWVYRLLPQWVAEIAQALNSDTDLDPEEE